ncbi:hypothetical protein LTR09_012660 [Extremus antarcticus]|uniref:Uncharacterized protein n=1 Tax=Extremus antarcticus TaxID=702011 RepID=A0AAJ0D4T1_9PEZI|nr:hypothetical protein LTR09_012660 [Extremus antarcticus]
MSNMLRQLHPEAADDTATPGSRANDPMYISDSEPTDEVALPSKLNFSTPGREASRQSSRSEALKEVHYNTAHHPQDKDLPVVRKRRRVSQSTTEEGNVRTSPTKRRKITSVETARTTSGRSARSCHKQPSDLASFVRI